MQFSVYLLCGEGLIANVVYVPCMQRITICMNMNKQCFCLHSVITMPLPRGWDDLREHAGSSPERTCSSQQILDELNCEEVVPLRILAHHSREGIAMRVIRVGPVQGRAHMRPDQVRSKSIEIDMAVHAAHVVFVHVNMHLQGKGMRDHVLCCQSVNHVGCRAGGCVVWPALAFYDRMLADCVVLRPLHELPPWAVVL